MRLSLLIGSMVLASALGGCAGTEGFHFNPQLNGTYGAGGNVTFGGDNATLLPANTTVDEPAPAPEPAPMIPLPMVEYTAPVPIDLARVEGDGATLRLQAGAEGLACISEPTWDPDAAPRGYKLVETWTTCSLSALNQTFVEQAAPAWNATLALTRDIPVDNFTWSMKVGRILENNTGAREEVVVEAEERLWAAPEAGLSVSPSRTQVCDVPFSMYDDRVQSFVFTATAHSGRAVLEVDLSGHHVHDVWSDQELTEENGTVTVVGPWAHRSVAQVEAIVEFEADDPGSLSSLYFSSMRCPGATALDRQSIGFQATAEGIGAGWHQTVDNAARIDVYTLAI